MKKIYIFLSICFITLFLYGCGILNISKKTSSASDMDKKISILRNDSLALQQKVSDLQKDVDLIKANLGTSTVKIKPDDLIFSSIRACSKQITQKNNVQYLNHDSKFDLKIDITNSSTVDINQYVCQAIIQYEANGETINVYQNETTFNVLPKTVRKDITISNVPVKSASIKHKLTIRIKDNLGNTIKTYSTYLDVI